MDSHPFAGLELTLSDRALYVILGVKLLYSGIASMALTFVVGTTVLHWQPPLTTPVPTLGDLHWGVLFFLVAFVTIGGGLGIWTVLSWLTASVVCPSARAAIHDRELFRET